MARYEDELDSVIHALTFVRERSLELGDHTGAPVSITLPAADLDGIVLLLERARERRARRDLARARRAVYAAIAALVLSGITLGIAIVNLFR